MLKLVLDHDYKQPFPAVDTSPFSNHGVVLNASHLPHGAQLNTGALHFTEPSSSVRVPMRQCWQRIGSIAVEAIVALEPAATRRNIIEGDGSFALFVNADDTIAASVYSLTDGSTSPAWNVVSSATHSPDGTKRKVSSKEWSKILFQHDGITRARIFIDGQLAAVRGDYRSGVPSVAGAGVVVGNWTLTSQYAFKGAIDRVRVWKLDEQAMLDAFTDRLDAKAQDAWDDIVACLHRSLNADQRVLLGRLFEDWEQILRELTRAVHGASPADREAFLELLTRYKAMWRSNQLNQPSGADLMQKLFELFERLAGAAWMQRLREFVGELVAVLGGAIECFKGGRLATADASFVSLIAQAASRMGDATGGPGGTDATGY